MQNSEFNLTGVKCAGCVAKIQNKLSTLAGVKSANVNLIDKTLHVEYADNLDIGALEQSITTAVGSLGYTASKNQMVRPAVNQYRQIGLPLVAGVLFMLSSMLLMPPYVPMSIASLNGVIQMLGSLFIILITADEIISSGVAGFYHLNLNMYSLITLGISAAWIYSTCVVLKLLDVAGVSHGVYFDSALIIVGLINLGSYFENKAHKNTFNAIRELLKLQPDTTTIIVDGIEQTIATNLLRTEYIVKVRPGQQISADGVIVDGAGYIDESMLTGEPMPVSKTIGSSVVAGTINTSGSFCFRVTAVGGNTILAKIIQLVKAAQNSKPKLAKLADRIAAIFVPCIIVIAIFSAVIWYLVGSAPQIFYAISVFMTVLIIACPCSVGLAIPTALMVGLGRSATHGILIRNASCLEQLGKLDYVLLDKTGTITNGTPQVVKFELLAPAVNDGANSGIELLQIAKSLESHSEHPLAQAILHYQPEYNVIGTVNEFNSIAGAGVSGVIDGRHYYLGQLKWLHKTVGHDAGIGDEHGYANDTTPCTTVFLADSERLLAKFSIADTIKTDSAIAVKELQHLGLNVAMVTGDNQASAEHIAHQVGIKQVFAERAPQDKIALVQELQRGSQVVAFVGDGINDAPSLVQADAGIAIGSGTDIAIQSADVTLMHSSLTDVARTITIARAINRNMRQNLFGAFIYNAAAVTCAAGVFYPLWHVLLNPVIAALAMSLSSITVVSNASRLRYL